MMLHCVLFNFPKSRRDSVFSVYRYTSKTVDLVGGMLVEVSFGTPNSSSGDKMCSSQDHPTKVAVKLFLTVHPKVYIPISCL